MAAAVMGHRPRPVADAPVLDGRELARAWLVELVSAAPLERAASLPGPGFTANAPKLCGMVAAALSSEAVFDDLAVAPRAVDAAIIAGAESAGEAVVALDRLRKVIWGAILEELRRPDPRQLADIADRLSAIISGLTAASLEGGVLRGATRPGDRGPLASVLRKPAPAEAEAEQPGDEPVEEAQAAAAPAGAAEPAPAANGGPALEVARIEDAASFASQVAPWTAAVERRLARHADDALPFAVLCVEVADLDRLVVAEHDGDVARALEEAEIAVSAQLRPADVLVRERPGRLWLVAPETDAEGARSIAHLIAAAVAGVGDHRGAPLEAAVGLATCPSDGADAAALEGRAEEGLFAARASGLRVAGPPRA